MKLRLNRGSIRFRLRQGDVQALLENGRVESAVALNNASFGFALQLHTGAATAQLEGGRLTIALPVAAVRHWATSEQITLSFDLAPGTRLLVEKDFACLEPRSGETNEGTFPRPVAEPSVCRAD